MLKNSRTRVELEKSKHVQNIQVPETGLAALETVPMVYFYLLACLSGLHGSLSTVDFVAHAGGGRGYVQLDDEDELEVTRK